MFELIIGAIVVFIAYRLSKRNEKEWEAFTSWPTLEEYWKQYPGTHTANGTKCYKCNSRIIWQTSFGRVATRKIHYCKQCNTWLYRSETY